jgi:hypothetical protein
MTTTHQSAYTFDDTGVMRQLLDGSIEAVRWADLIEVRIITTADGPLAEDVFWVLVGPGQAGCVVAGEFAGPLLPYLQKLPNFDNDAVIRAMSSTDQAEFLCWRKGGSTPG